MCVECESAESELLCAEGAAKLLPLTSAATLRRWASKGQIAHVRLPNGRLFFQREAIEALLEPVPATPSAGIPVVTGSDGGQEGSTSQGSE